MQCCKLLRSQEYNPGARSSSHSPVSACNLCFVSVNVNEIEANLLKLGYNEVLPCPETAAETWKRILEKGDEPVDKKILLEAVKAGMSITMKVRKL